MPAAITVRVSADDVASHPSLRVLAVGRAGFFVSSRTPAAKVAELGDAIRSALQKPAVRKAMKKTEIPPMPMGVDYATLIADERAEWQARIARHGFSADS